MAESSVPGAVGERPDSILEIVDAAFPTGGTEGPNAWTDERIRVRTRFAEQVERILSRSGGAVGEREELDVERLRKAWYGHEDTHPGLPCVAVKCVEEVAFAYSKAK